MHMSKYNICYWCGEEKAWNDINIDEQYYYGDNLITIIAKTDSQITMQYYDGHIRRLSKKQALRCLQR